MKKFALVVALLAVLAVIAGCGGGGGRSGTVVVPPSDTTTVSGTIQLLTSTKLPVKIAFCWLNGYNQYEVAVQSTVPNPSSGSLTTNFSLILPKPVYFRYYTLLAYHDSNGNGKLDEGEDRKWCKELINYNGDENGWCYWTDASHFYAVVGHSFTIQFTP